MVRVEAKNQHVIGQVKTPSQRISGRVNEATIASR